MSLSDIATTPAATGIIALAGLFVSFVSLFVAIHTQIFVRRRRHKALLSPTEGFFIVPAKQHHDCEYATQDGESHKVKEITLLPHSEVGVDMILECKVAFAHNEIAVGFLGNDAAKPYAKEYFNRFIEVGDGQRVVPGDEKDRNTHYIDKHKFYHVRGAQAQTRSLGSVIAAGFTIVTREPGLYPVRIDLPGDEIEGSIWHLFITVEDQPTIAMKCMFTEHRHMPCATEIQARRFNASCHSSSSKESGGDG